MLTGPSEEKTIIKAINWSGRNILIILLRDEWTNITLVEQISGAMSILSTIGKERGLSHTTEVPYLPYLPNLIKRISQHSLLR